LRDGETQVLAGLISDEDRRSASRVPGLGDLPIAGRLFSSTRDTNNRSEIVLLITPRLVRTLVRPDGGSVEFAAGTEASSGARPGAAPVVIAPQVQPQPPDQPVEPDAKPAAQPAAPTLVPFGGIKPPAQ
jgi:general secretion pathway protein D